METIIKNQAPTSGSNSYGTFDLNGRRYLVIEIGAIPSSVADQMRDAVNEARVKAAEKSSVTEKKKYVYGLKGLADLFGCSKSTAYNIKRSGKIDSAISQIGNTIVIDAERALNLVKK